VSRAFRQPRWVGVQRQGAALVTCNGCGLEFRQRTQPVARVPLDSLKGPTHAARREPRADDGGRVPAVLLDAQRTEATRRVCTEYGCPPVRPGGTGGLQRLLAHDPHGHGRRRQHGCLDRAALSRAEGDVRVRYVTLGQHQHKVNLRLGLLSNRASECAVGVSNGGTPEAAPRTVCQVEVDESPWRVKELRGWISAEHGNHGKQRDQQHSQQHIVCAASSCSRT
jgi:hypothetical protein